MHHGEADVFDVLPTYRFCPNHQSILEAIPLAMAGS
jgi:hypothetical protein